ncbi:MAG: hypothetical protein U0M51_09265 [Eggerthellaceae bacterium]
MIIAALARTLRINAMQHVVDGVDAALLHVDVIQQLTTPVYEDALSLAHAPLGARTGRSCRGIGVAGAIAQAALEIF